jgi:hypothetical protein
VHEDGEYCMVTNFILNFLKVLGKGSWVGYGALVGVMVCYIL